MRCCPEEPASDLGLQLRSAGQHRRRKPLLSPGGPLRQRKATILRPDGASLLSAAADDDDVFAPVELTRRQICFPQQLSSQLVEGAETSYRNSLRR